MNNKFFKLPIFFFLMGGVLIAQNALARSISIMTFNVENLFDTQDDPLRRDHSYLPIEAKNTEAHRTLCLSEFEAHGINSWYQQCLNMNWDESTLQRKLENLAGSILQVNEGRGPDVLILQEVENGLVLERLRTEYLQAAEYSRSIIAEANDQEQMKRDERGIDAAILTRLPKAGHPRLHQTSFSSTVAEHLADTREILEQKLYLPDGTDLTVFAVHLPAQFLPAEMRHQQLAHINQLTANLMNRNKAFIVAGDFNISREEEENGIYENHLNSNLSVSHKANPHQTPGSYYSRWSQSWSFLDALIYPNYLQEKIIENSFRSATAFAEQVRNENQPKRFNPENGTGVSDHFPLIIEFNFPESTFYEGPESLNRRKEIDLFIPPQGENTPVRLALFDADSTLRVTNNGSPTPNTPSNVIAPLPFCAEKITEYAAQGYFIAILSNQGGVPRMVSFENADAALFKTVELIQEQGGTVHYMDFAAHKNADRKPNPGMALRLEEFIKEKYQRNVDWQNSFMVGDAAYTHYQSRPLPDTRPGFNFSSSDRGLAEELGITFYEPDTFFGWDQWGITRSHPWGVEKITNQWELSELLELIENEN